MEPLWSDDGAASASSLGESSLSLGGLAVSAEPDIKQAALEVNSLIASARLQLKDDYKHKHAVYGGSSSMLYHQQARYISPHQPDNSSWRSQPASPRAGALAGQQGGLQQLRRSCGQSGLPLRESSSFADFYAARKGISPNKAAAGGSITTGSLLMMAATAAAAQRNRYVAYACTCPCISSPACLLLSHHHEATNCKTHTHTQAPRKLKSQATT